MKSNYKLSKMYYYYLAKAGSYWGKKISKDIYRVNDVSNNKLDLDKEMNLINSTRRQYIRFKEEEKENIKIYDISPLALFINKWVLLHNIIPYLAVPVITIIFYLPLSLIGIQEKTIVGGIPSSEKFIVTKEFVDQVTKVSPPPLPDTTPPPPPSGLSVQ